jgi:peptidoglycan/xylan/chitin deacetylase (PgdA/CDA1 family)
MGSPCETEIPVPRFDRFVSVCISEPLLHFDRLHPGSRLPILMYHSISDDREERVKPYYRVATSPRRFAEQMQWLSDFGYEGLALEEALSVLASGTVSDRCPVALTFDDGFQDSYRSAWPILQRHNFTATMYLPTGFVAQDRKMFRGKGCLTWDEVRELRQAGVRFGSHTVSHPKLHELPWRAVEHEAKLSKQQLEQELQEEIIGFAYPYAFPQEDRDFVQRLSELLSLIGYQYCATTVLGRAQRGDDPLLLRRLPVNSWDDRALFVAKLRGAYDWLGPIQRVSRCLRARRPRAATNRIAAA